MATLLEKNTKKLVERKLDALFAKQQALNGNKGSNTGAMPVAESGWSQDNPPGGYTIKPYNWQNGIQGFGMDSYQANFGLNPLPQIKPFMPMYKGNLPTGAGVSNMPTLQMDNSLKYVAPNDQMTMPDPLGSLNTPNQSNINFSNPKDNPNVPGFKPTPAGTEGTNWGKVGTFAAQMSPLIYNLAKGLQKPTKVTPNYNPYNDQIRSTMANRRFNVEPLLTSNATAQAVNNRNIYNSGNSRGEVMSNLGASQNARMAGDATAWAQKNNMDNQYLGEQATMDANLGNNIANMDWQTQMANLQSKAATNRFMGQGLNDLGQFAQIQQLMGNQTFRDQQLASLYPDMYSQIYQFQPAMQAIIKAAGGK